VSLQRQRYKDIKLKGLIL